MEWLGYPAVKSYNGLDLTTLPLNHAWVTANTTIDSVSIYSMRNDCFNCPYKLMKHLKGNVTESWQVDTSKQLSWRIVRTPHPVEYMSNRNKQGWFCEMRPTFHEYGVYRLDVGKCEIRPEVTANHTYYPFLLCSLVLLAACMIYTFINFIRERKRRQKGLTQEKVLQINEENNEDRLNGLYIFRGLLLSMIIFMTTGGGGYPIFNNSWGGLTFAECLFFAYIWSIGLYIPTVMDQACKQHSKCTVIRDIFVKAAVLLFVGTVIDSTVETRRYTIPLWCPLQRLGVAYVFVSTVYVLTVQKFEMKSKMIICKAISNFINLMWCWIIGGFVLAIFIISISTFISFNCLGNIGLEVQRADYSAVMTDVTANCNNNLNEYINKLFIGEYVKMANVNGYVGIKAGAFGAMSTILYMLLGLKAGVVYLNNRSHSDRIKLWNLWGTLFGIGSICLAVGSYPLDFNLWPIASILLISAASFYIFSVIYILVEVFSLSNNFLYSIGVTSLVILSGHLLLSNSVPFHWQITLNNHLLYLVQNYWIVFLWSITGVLLCRRDVKFEI